MQWTAKQIGQSGGAYAGKTVTFTDETGVRQSGTLTRSDWPTGNTTMVIVDGAMYFLPNETLVEVA
jgi:hypothetical protein